MNQYFAKAVPSHAQLGEYGVEAAVIAANTIEEAKEMFGKVSYYKHITIEQIQGATVAQETPSILHRVAHIQ